jgi:uncharacterized protein (TIGR02588 family)
MAKSKGQSGTAAGYPALQWAAAGLGLIVTLTAVGIVVWEALQAPNPSLLRARIDEVVATRDGYVAQITVINDGDGTAVGVEVEAVLGQEVAGVTLDYVPGHGEAGAHLQFEADPTAARIRVLGWATP